MDKLYWITVFAFISGFLHAQSASLECLNGIFVKDQSIPREYISLENPPEWDTIHGYRLMKDGRELGVAYNSKRTIVTRHYFSCYVVYNERHIDVVDVDVNLECDTSASIFYYRGFDCEFGAPTFYKWNGADYFSRTERLPPEVYQYIYNLGLNYNRDFFLEFLDISVKSTCLDELDAYDAIDGSVVASLRLNELVEVKQVNGEWVKISALSNDEVYWLYMSCLE